MADHAATEKKEEDQNRLNHADASETSLSFGSSATIPRPARDANSSASIGLLHRRNQPSLRLKPTKRRRVPTPFPSPRRDQQSSSASSYSPDVKAAGFASQMIRVAECVLKLSSGTMTYLTNPRRSLSHQIDETKSQTDRLFSGLQALVRIHFEELELARQGGGKSAVDGGGSSVALEGIEDDTTQSTVPVSPRKQMGQ